jgi:hypothetical protein
MKAVPPGTAFAFLWRIIFRIILNRVEASNLVRDLKALNTEMDIFMNR